MILYCYLFDNIWCQIAITYYNNIEWMSKLKMHLFGQFHNICAYNYIWVFHITKISIQSSFNSIHQMHSLFLAHTAHIVKYCTGHILLVWCLICSFSLNCILQEKLVVWAIDSTESWNFPIFACRKITLILVLCMSSILQMTLMEVVLLVIHNVGICKPFHYYKVMNCEGDLPT